MAFLADNVEHSIPTLTDVGEHRRSIFWALDIAVMNWDLLKDKIVMAVHSRLINDVYRQEKPNWTWRNETWTMLPKICL